MNFYTLCTLANGLTRPKNTCIDRQALIISVDGKTRKLHLFIVKDKKAVAKQSGSSLLAKFFFTKRHQKVLHFESIKFVSPLSEL